MNSTKTFIVLAFFASIFLQCTGNNQYPIEFVGKINKLGAKLLLSQDGDKFIGELNYLQKNEPTTNVIGFLNTRHLTLHEFDAKNNFSGTFEGTYDSISFTGNWLSRDKTKKLSFAFSRSNNNINKKGDFVSLNPNELISHFFNVDKFKNDKYAYYDNSSIAVKYDGIKYLFDETQALAFFSNFLLDSEGKEENCHACSGFVSIARIERIGDQWKVISFVEDCECGSDSWGQTTIPEVVTIGNTYFLKNTGGYLNQGYYNGGTTFYDIDNYKPVLSLKEANNSGASGAVGEIFSYNSEVRFEEINGKIKAIVTYQGTDYNQEKRILEDISRREIYFYDKNTRTFIKE